MLQLVYHGSQLFRPLVILPLFLFPSGMTQYFPGDVGWRVSVDGLSEGFTLGFELRANLQGIVVGCQLEGDTSALTFLETLASIQGLKTQTKAQVKFRWVKKIFANSYFQQIFQSKPGLMYLIQNIVYLYQYTEGPMPVRILLVAIIIHVQLQTH